MGFSRLYVAAGLVVALASSVGPVRAESPISLTVRIYNAAGVSPGAIRAARDAAAPILRDTGLAVTFRLCGVSDETSVVDRCDDVLKPSEVVVRLIEAPAFNAALDRDAFGMTYIVRDTDRGWLATVFADRIAPAAARVGLDPGTMAGLVLAHEVGHLLIGQGYHGDAGLMRAQWPDAVLETRTPSNWRFSMAETEVIRRRLQPAE